MEAVSNASASNPLNLPRPPSGGSNELGHDDFLHLMMIQFKNQDPLSPVQNEQFLAQLAQFSTVSGISEMNESMASLAASIQASQALQAASIVGRDVLVDSDTGYMSADQPLKGSVDVPVDAAEVHVRIVDSSGATVREIALGTQSPGMADFEWDGLTSEGEQAPDGEYKIVAEMREGSQAYGLPTLVAARVDSVALGNYGGGAMITTDSGLQLPLSNVRAIR